ncbi:hypothetical protein [Paenimyroides baculatum]|uniref:Uncharacterized protein n=1 Tax=Paenimyroides baculatum TaxID=2608000 RepID=A0A5M6CCU5_9FLAO|nr:hypothetical protein [Paenimyroides baculatum]KAA5531652.1 hypothetical protein F0460_15815 [Paenimyroides baculatum]
MTNKLIVRMSKNIFLKDKNYTITINENEQTHILNITRNKIEIDLNNEFNKIEISSKNNSKSFLIKNENNSVKFLNVHSNLTYEFALGVFIGFAFIASIIISLLSLNSGVNLLLIFITFLPLFFLKKENFEDGFEIKELNK